MVENLVENRPRRGRTDTGRIGVRQAVPGVQGVRPGDSCYSKNSPNLTGVGAEREGFGELEREWVRRAGECEYESLYGEYELVTNVHYGGEQSHCD